MQTVSQRSFGVALVLALFAGCVDAVGFVVSGGLFVSFMSGNSTQANVEAALGDPQIATVALSLVLGFVVGVILGRLSAESRHQPIGIRILILGLALTIATVVVAKWPHPGYSLTSLAAVMGAMNTLFTSEGRAQVPVTYATGTLVSLGLGIADRITGTRRGAWIRPLLLWSAIAFGALVGALGWSLLGIWTLLAPAIGLFLIGTAHTYHARKSASHPPTPEDT